MRTIQHKLHQPKMGSAVGAALGILSGLLIFFTIFSKDLDGVSFDLPFMLFRDPSPGARDDVVIIKLDDTSYDQLKQSPHSFDGSLHANLIRRLKTEGVKVIVFDILFIDKDPPPGDDALAAAAKDHKGVVLAGKLQKVVVEGGPKLEPVPLRPTIEDATAGWGLALIDAPAGATVRKHFGGTERIPSLAWKAAQVAGVPIARDERDRLRPRWLNYYGPKLFVSIPYYQTTNAQFKFPVSLSGKTVFVGRALEAGYAGEEKDQYSYPWTPLKAFGEVSPFGIEFHALTYANLVNGDWLRRLPTWVEALLLAIIGGGLGYLLPKMRPLPAAGIAVGSALLIVVVGCVSQLMLNTWFGWLTPVAVQIPIVLIWAILFHSIRSYFEAEFLNRSLSLYVSPGQVQEMLRDPELLKPGVKQREVSILFTDIANFSKISERMVPEDLANLLNDYYETAISSVHETGGTVVNLIGDAILAIWNAPLPQSDHGDRACRAATALANKLVVFDATRKGLRLQTRVGLHSGMASVGNIGSSSKFMYTVIGDNVNLASRLEGLNKFLGTSILATRHIQKLVEDKMPNRLVGHFRFKGLDQVVEIYELLHAEEPSSKDSPWLQDFSKGIHCFQRAAFSEATKHFQSVLAARPGDGPSDFYLKRIQELEKAPPGPNWMGEVDLSEK